MLLSLIGKQKRRIVTFNHLQQCVITILCLLLMFFVDERVPSELKKRISQARLDKKLTQAQLAQVGTKCSYVLLGLSDLRPDIILCLMQQINEKPSVINEYESGKAIPNPQVLSKMSKVLGVQLSAKVGKKKMQE